MRYNTIIIYYHTVILCRKVPLIMISYFITKKEQKKLDLFQFILFAKNEKTSQEIISKFKFSNTSFRRYIHELSEDINYIFGDSVKISNNKRKGIKVVTSPEITIDYIIITTRMSYIRKNPLYDLVRKLTTKSYYSVSQLALDLNFSEPVVYRLLSQLGKILKSFDAKINFKSSFNFDGDEMGVRYFLFLTYWYLFQDPSVSILSEEFTDVKFLKERLHINKELSEAQETKLKILAKIVSYRIILMKKTVFISENLIEDISFFYYGEPTLNIESYITSEETLKKESILFSFIVQGVVCNIITYEQKQALVHKYKNSNLPLAKQVTSFLEKFRKELNITYTAINYVESYYLILLTFIYIKYFHFKAYDYLMNPIKDNIELYKKNKRYMKVLAQIKPFIKQLPFKKAVSLNDEYTFSLLLYILYEINSSTEQTFIYVTHNTNMAEVNLIKSEIRKMFNKDLISFSETPYKADIIITDTFDGDFDSKKIFYFRCTSERKIWSDLFDFILECIFEKTF